MDRKPDAASFLDRYATPVAVILLLIFCFHVLTLIPRKSLTVDEPANIAVGFAFLKTGDVNLGEDTPPLVRVISALPLLALHPRLPLEDSSWQDRIHWKFGNVFFDSNPPPLYFRMIFWSRVPMVLLACALGGWVYFVARRFFGSSAALAALFLLASSLTSLPTRCWSKTTSLRLSSICGSSMQRGAICFPRPAGSTACSHSAGDRDVDEVLIINPFRSRGDPRVCCISSA